MAPLHRSQHGTSKASLGQQSSCFRSQTTNSVAAATAVLVVGILIKQCLKEGCSLFGLRFGGSLSSQDRLTKGVPVKQDQSMNEQNIDNAVARQHGDPDGINTAMEPHDTDTNDWSIDTPQDNDANLAGHILNAQCCCSVQTKQIEALDYPIPQKDGPQTINALVSWKRWEGTIKG